VGVIATRRDTFGDALWVHAVHRDRPGRGHGLIKSSYKVGKDL
jgi:hypothetical protein